MILSLLGWIVLSGVSIILFWAAMLFMVFILGLICVGLFYLGIWIVSKLTK